jgi:hypothetical protein
MASPQGPTVHLLSPLWASRLLERIEIMLDIQQPTAFLTMVDHLVQWVTRTFTTFKAHIVRHGTSKTGELREGRTPRSD